MLGNCDVKDNYKWDIHDYKRCYPDKRQTGLSVIHYTSKTTSIKFFIHFLQ